MAFMRSGDSSIKGIFWQDEENSSTYGYVFENESFLTQFIKDNKIIWQKNIVEDDEKNKIETKLKKFRTEFNNQIDQFITISNENYFIDRGLKYVDRNGGDKNG